VWRRERVGRTATVVEAVGEDLVAFGEAVVSEDPTAVGEDPAVVGEVAVIEAVAWTRRWWRSERAT
jgi:hypothetical protein